MYKKILFTVLIFSFCLFFTDGTLAIENPLVVPNNNFGIHIVDPADLNDAARLVNSSGGDWGYVTMVITEAERDRGKWQKAFDQMRKLHLIPIVRLATKTIGDTWDKPRQEEVDNWVSFLNSLNWVVKNRYVIVFNEPNHAKEWGGGLNPQEYSGYLKNYSIKLKAASEDFFVLPAGLDASAPNSSSTMDEKLFLKKMQEENPDIFDYIDGWTSHSYPNPDFSGKVTDRGRGTIGTFDWELNYLRSLGLSKKLPVFITETGWRHELGEENNISGKLKGAFETLWIDKRIAAVTPFILNYTQPPFDVFSWKRNENSFYDFYFDTQKIAKKTGAPTQEVKGDLLWVLVQPIQLAGVEFKGVVLAKNIGQSIWNTDNITLSAGGGDVKIKSFSFAEVDPQNLGLITFTATTPEIVGTYPSSVVLKHDEKEISNPHSFEVVSFKPSGVQIASIFDRITAYIKFFRGKY